MQNSLETIIEVLIKATVMLRGGRIYGYLIFEFDKSECVRRKLLLIHSNLSELRFSTQSL